MCENQWGEKEERFMAGVEAGLRLPNCLGSITPRFGGAQPARVHTSQTQKLSILQRHILNINNYDHDTSITFLDGETRLI
jgi:hypothetical protein